MKLPRKNSGTNGARGRDRKIPAGTLRFERVTKHFEARARAISDMGFFEFRRQLEYKAAIKGASLSFPSAQRYRGNAERFRGITDRHQFAHFDKNKANMSKDQAISLKPS
jgi:hypothetical protein